MNKLEELENDKELQMYMRREAIRLGIIVDDSSPCPQWRLHYNPDDMIIISNTKPDVVKPSLHQVEAPQTGMIGYGSSRITKDPKSVIERILDHNKSSKIDKIKATFKEQFFDEGYAGTKFRRGYKSALSRSRRRRVK